MKGSIVLSTAYFGPVHYFSALLKNTIVYIEQWDHYQKQTYRNRCIILSGNGPIPLTIPVVKSNGNKTQVKDIKIFNSEAWQTNHLRALKAAYHNSPFYEYYIDALLPVWDKKWNYLVDLNTFILECIREEIEHDFQFQLTNEYLDASKYEKDLRDTIHPKIQFQKADPSFQPPIYHQVFLNRFPFHPNLSILDLLFNKGPETADYLISCNL